MSQFNMASKAFVVNEVVIEPYRRVKLTAGSGTLVRVTMYLGMLPVPVTSAQVATGVVVAPRRAVPFQIFLTGQVPLKL